MSKKVYYSDIKIIKKPLKTKIKSFFKFFLFIAVFISIIYASIGLSNALKVGNIGSLIIYGDTQIKRKEHKLYAVTLGKYETKEQAESVAIGSTLQGASGYVWEDQKYYVIGSLYSSYDDASKVIKNLSDSQYKCEIYEIVFPSIKISLNDYENKQVSDINAVFQYIDDLYNRIYEYSIKFDQKEMNNFAVSSKISELRGECKTYISSVQEILNNKNDKIKIIQNTLILLDELLNEAILKTIDNSTSTYIIKYTLLKIARLKFDLYNQM